MKNIYESVAANKRRSCLVVLFFFLFVGLALYFITQAVGIYLGYQPGGFGYLGLALIVSGLTSLGSYYFSDKIILGISGARPAERKRDFNFYTVTENLAIGAGLPKPRLFIIEDSATNAFATGRDHDHAVVCATRGLLDKLNRTELEGVIAHELAHIKNFDMRLMSLVAVMVGTVALVGDWFFRIQWHGRGGQSRDRDSSQLAYILMLLGIVFAILSPIIANLIKLAISRRREFLADAGSVVITRQPRGLINALEKISADHEPLEVANKATAHLYIASPFKDKISSGVSRFSNLFNTHPPMEERIAALKEMM